MQRKKGAASGDDRLNADSFNSKKGPNCLTATSLFVRDSGLFICQNASWSQSDMRFVPRFIKSKHLPPSWL
jgi:hypothetical protein